MEKSKHGRDEMKTNRYRGEILWFLAVLLCFSWTFSSCKKKEAEVPKERIINVRTWVVEKKPLRPFIETVGTLKPYEEVIVSSELDGIVHNVAAENGMRVARGMALARINDTDFRLEVERAAAALRQAEATFANTKQEYMRKEPLFREGLVTKQQFDDISARLVLAEGDVERSRVALSLAKERLAKTTVYSPISGWVKEKRVTRGDYMRNGTPLFSLIQTDQLKLVFPVSEKDVASLKTGQDVIFKVDAFPNREFKGKLTTIYPSLEEKSRTLQVEAVIPNSAGALKPGFFARVTIYTGSVRDTVVVPTTSLIYENATTKVFLINDGIAKEKYVKAGLKYGDFMEILEGLQGGEQLVVIGQNNLTEGVKVYVAR